MSLITLTPLFFFRPDPDSAVGDSDRPNPGPLLVIAKLSPLSPMRPSSYHGAVRCGGAAGDAVWMAEAGLAFADPVPDEKVADASAMCSPLPRNRARYVRYADQRGS
jgi:hypothetical protein